MKLSVLDQSTAAQGRTQDVAIRETLELARRCDALGYHRYWVSEHHNSNSIVGTAPEVLMAAIAATTQRIRVGSAGVMLPHYSALKVAEQFRVLEGIAPGRIDLGVGRAPGSDQRTAYALNPNADAHEEFPQQVSSSRRGFPARRCRGNIRSASIKAQSARAHEPRAVDTRQFGLRRAVRRAFRAAVCFRLLLHRRQRRRAGTRPLPPQLSSQRAPPDAAGDHLRVGSGGRYGSGSAAPGNNARALAHPARRGHTRCARHARRSCARTLIRMHSARASNRCAGKRSSAAQSRSRRV